MDRSSIPAWAMPRVAVPDNIRNQFTVLTDVADLRRTLKTVAAVDPKGRVKLAFNGGRITFSCQGGQGGWIRRRRLRRGSA